MEWQTVNTVPRGRDVEIAVIDSEGVFAVAHPCRLTEHGWIVAESKKWLYRVRPTHWRDCRLRKTRPNRTVVRRFLPPYFSNSGSFATLPILRLIGRANTVGWASATSSVLSATARGSEYVQIL